MMLMIAGVKLADDEVRAGASDGAANTQLISHS